MGNLLNYASIHILLSHKKYKITGWSQKWKYRIKSQMQYFWGNLKEYRTSFIIWGYFKAWSYLNLEFPVNKRKIKSLLD